MTASDWYTLAGALLLLAALQGMWAWRSRSKRLAELRARRQRSYDDMISRIE